MEQVYNGQQEDHGYVLLSILDIGKSGRGKATANQGAEFKARTAGSGRGACIRKAYVFMRCPGQPCTNGDHCWQNEAGRMKGNTPQPHHARILADYLLAGKDLNGYDDVLDNFRRLVLDDEHEQEVRELKE
jgi:hypothetical protein